MFRLLSLVVVALGMLASSARAGHMHDADDKDHRSNKHIKHDKNDHDADDVEVVPFARKLLEPHSEDKHADGNKGGCNNDPPPTNTDPPPVARHFPEPGAFALAAIGLGAWLLVGRRGFYRSAIMKRARFGL
jgi:hypothetical protein